MGFCSAALLQSRHREVGGGGAGSKQSTASTCLLPPRQGPSAGPVSSLLTLSAQLKEETFFQRLAALAVRMEPSVVDFPLLNYSWM